MVPTYVTGVPTGKEIGYVSLHAMRLACLRRNFRTFLALDLGGTNLCECGLTSRAVDDLITSCSRRVCEVKLDGAHGVAMRQQKYKVSDELKTGEANLLFGESLVSDLLRPHMRPS
jgi:hexokinase